MKKITVINGMTDDSNLTFEKDLNQLLDKYKSKAEFEEFHIRNMDIKYCCGCFGCWLKTPGECLQKDEMPGILKSIINSDLTVFVSPVNMGFVSSNIKKVSDKLIPLIHPYIGIFNDECHHIKRYDKYPKLGLILVDRKSQRRDSYGIVTDIYKRMALNFKSELAFSILSHGNMEEIEHAINHF